MESLTEQRQDACNKERYSDNNDFTFFTNEDGCKLEDRFRKILSNVKYFDILVGYFRTSGFYRLYKEFENIDKIRILVGLDVDRKTVEIINHVKDQQSLNFESHTNTKERVSERITKELYNSEDSYNVELGVKKFIEFIETGKLEIRAYPDSNIHAKVYISRFHENDRDLGRVITGSSNFSESGLKAQYEFNVELKNKCDVRYALKKFEELWKDGVDINETYISTIKNKTWLNDTITPYEMYLKFLYENFKSRLETKRNIDSNHLPSGYLDLKYQKDAVLTLDETVKVHNGAFISDVVGLGKTIISAWYMSFLQGKKLIICPPPIKESWENEIQNFEIGGAKVISLGGLEKFLKSGSAEEYKYIFVDEAHRFRNEKTRQYELLHQICYGKKVILITATPLNNSIYDFYPLIKLFQAPNNSTIPEVKNLDDYFSRIRIELSKLDKSTPQYFDRLKEISSDVRSGVLQPLMIRRTRSTIKKYFSEDMQNRGLFFPEVDTPYKIVYKFDGKTNLLFEKTMKKLKDDFELARYSYKLKDAFKDKKTPTTQDINLTGFLKTMLVKRMESSTYAFLQTIDRFIKSYEYFIKMFDNGVIYLGKDFDIEDYYDSESEDFINEIDNKNTEAKVYTKEQFEEDYIDKLNTDLEILQWIKEEWSGIKDFKFEEFKNTLQNNPVLNNGKIIIFTESMETGIYLYKNLFSEYGRGILFYSSNISHYQGNTVSSGKAKELIHENYDPKSVIQKDDIRILITTDVLAEGINLHRSNVIVNYDLPWNPTRVLQRVGRVNRVGTKFDKIHIFNIFPTSVTDSEIKLEDNIKAKLQAFHETLGADAKYLFDTEIPSDKTEFTDKLYRDLTENTLFKEEDEDEDDGFKYLKLLEDVRDNNIDLYNKIKYLPRKARIARTFEIEKDALVTFFKKGEAKKFCMTDGKNYQDLSFNKAVKYFECEKDCVRKEIPKEFYDLLALNNNKFIESETDEETVHKAKDRRHDKYVKDRILFAIKEGKLTDSQEDLLKRVLDLYEQGVLPFSSSKKIKEETETSSDSRILYNSVLNNIPSSYLNGNVNKQIEETGRRTDIILSEMLLGRGC